MEGRKCYKQTQIVTGSENTYWLCIAWDHLDKIKYIYLYFVSGEIFQKKLLWNIYVHCLCGFIIMSTYTYCKCKITIKIIQFSSVTKSYLTLCDPMGLQHARLPCPSWTPGVYSNSCPLSQWWHPIISSVIPFSSLNQTFPASGSFQMSQFFASHGQRFGVSASASVLPMNIQDRFPLGWTGWI